MKGLANSYYFRFVDKYEAWTMVKLGDEGRQQPSTGI